MELAQVFANNIQISQMKKVIPQYEWNEKRFQEERSYFLWWLLHPSLGGRYNFKDQLRAWEVYALYHEIEELDDEEEFTPSWMEEIDNKIRSSIKFGNYSEFGGQQ